MPAAAYAWVTVPETSVEFWPSPQSTVMSDPLTGRVISWLAAVVLQVVTKACLGGSADTPETSTPTIRQLLPFSKTRAPAAVTLTM